MPDLGQNQSAPRLPQGESPKVVFKLLPRPRPMGESPKEFFKRMRRRQEAAAAPSFAGKNLGLVLAVIFDGDRVRLAGKGRQGFDQQEPLMPRTGNALNLPSLPKRRAELISEIS
jgi:hypothetical protein